MYHHKRPGTKVAHELGLAIDICFQRVMDFQDEKTLQGSPKLSSTLIYKYPLQEHPPWFRVDALHNMEFSHTIVKWLSMEDFQPDFLGSGPLALIIAVVLDKFFGFNFFKTGMIIWMHNFLFVILKYKIFKSQKILEFICQENLPWFELKMNLT